MSSFDLLLKRQALEKRYAECVDKERSLMHERGHIRREMAAVHDAHNAALRANGHPESPWLSSLYGTKPEYIKDTQS